MLTPRVAGTTIAACIVLLGLLAPLIAPYPPNQMFLESILLPPNSQFWLGTDALGRDVLSRLLYGAQTSLGVGLVAVGLAIALGVLVGLAAGLGGRFTDALLMRLTDIMLTFPTIFLILAVIAMLKPSLLNVMIIIGLTSWMGVARLVRAEALSLKNRPYIQAASLGGTRPLRLAWRHVLPNLLPPIATSASLGLAAAILTEAGLSYLGLGVQPPTPSWGAMLTEGKSVMEVAWWLTALPGVAILMTVLGFTLAVEK
jgi:peptide/nickel transport system permease protein